MIRKASPEDRPLLKALLEEFYETDAVLHPLPASYHEAALEELFSGWSMQRAYVLETETAPAGYALLSLKYSHEAGGMELWVEELYVRPAFRGLGLGRAFFATLLEEADREGIARIRLEVEPENIRAAALYARMGFHPLGYAQMSREHPGSRQ